MKLMSRIGGGVLAVALLAWAAVFFVSRQVRASSSDGLLTGSVQSASGEKMAGVTVSARRKGSNIITSVFTDGHGNYYFPPMDNGSYKVWAQADTYRYTSAAVNLKDVQRQNFVLKPMADYFTQLTGDQVLASLPDSTPKDRRMGRMFRNFCTGCHPPNFPLENRFNQAGWKVMINLMSEITIYGTVNPKLKDFAPVPAGTSYPLAHRKEFEQRPFFFGMQHVYFKANENALAAWLASIRGPGPSAITKIHLRPRPTGKAARVVFTEYDIPVDPALHYPYKYTTNDGSDWSLGTPSRINGGFGIHDAVTDLAGNIWFAYSRPTPDITIGRVDGKTGAVKFFKVAGMNGLATRSHGMTRDLHGNIWFNIGPGPNGQSAGIAMVNPTTQKIETFRPPKSMTVGLGNSLDAGPKGNIWVTNGKGAVVFNPVTKQFRAFKSPTLVDKAGVGNTYGITVDSEGNGWWTQIAIDIVDKADIKTGKVTAIHLPPVKSQLNNATPAEKRLYAEFGSTGATLAVPWAVGPRRLGADWHGDTVWVNEFWGGHLVKININTMKVTLIPYPQPKADQGYQAKVDDHHNVWVDMQNADAVMEYNPGTSKWTVYPLPSLGTENRYLDLLERNGSLQQVIVPYWRLRKVARMTFRTEAQIQVLKKQVALRERAAM